MAKKLFDRTLGTPAETDRIAYGTGATAAGNILLSAFRTLLLDTAWIQPTLATGYTNIVYHPFRYRKNKLGQLEIKGGIVNSGAVSTPFFTLPNGYQPTAGYIYFPCYAVNGNGEGEISFLQISPGGEMSAYIGGGLSANHETHFNCALNL